MTLIRAAHGVELHTDGVSYWVSRDGVEIVRTRVETLANISFEEAATDADPRRDALAKERAFYDMQRSRSESFSRRASQARKSGGKGGRGGV